MLATLVDGWLARFEAALGRGDGAALRELFHPECHWRDLLAFTWDIRTVSGVDAVVTQFLQHAARAPAHGFRIDPERTAPRETTRAGEKCSEAESTRRRVAAVPRNAEGLDAAHRAAGARRP